MTSMESGEGRVRAALEELRAADEHAAPAFAAILTRRGHRAPLRPHWTVLGAATILVASTVIYRITRPVPLEIPSEVLALSAWTPPTDVLLEGARKHIPTQAPRFGASLLDTLHGDFR